MQGNFVFMQSAKLVVLMALRAFNAVPRKPWANSERETGARVWNEISRGANRGMYPLLKSLRHTQVPPHNKKKAPGSEGLIQKG